MSVGDIMSTPGHIMSTPGDVQYTGVSIRIQLFRQWPSSKFIVLSPQCTHDNPPVYSPTVLMISLSVLDFPCCNIG